MNWRTIIVRKQCKLTYKDGYLVIRNDNVQMIHLSEIKSIIIEDGMTSITSYLINELSNQKIKLIFCDEKHNPSSEIVPYYANTNTSKRIQQQIEWKMDKKQKVWNEIVKMKILNQARLLEKRGMSESGKIKQYINCRDNEDITVKEGYVAKEYFSYLFGSEFKREKADNTNIALDYGYSIILLMFNREIVNKGYITQVGIGHKSQFNYFNFSCDLMEIFRPLIDEIVVDNRELVFSSEFRDKLVNIVNREIIYNNKKEYVPNAISLYVQNILDNLNSDEESIEILNYEF